MHITGHLFELDPGEQCYLNMRNSHAAAMTLIFLVYAVVRVLGYSPSGWSRATGEGHSLFDSGSQLRRP